MPLPYYRSVGRDRRDPDRSMAELLPYIVREAGE